MLLSLSLTNDKCYTHLIVRRHQNANEHVEEDEEDDDAEDDEEHLAKYTVNRNMNTW